MSSLTDICQLISGNSSLLIMLGLIGAFIGGRASGPYPILLLRNPFSCVVKVPATAATSSPPPEDTKPSTNDPPSHPRLVRANLPANPDAPLWTSLFPTLQAHNLDDPRNAEAQVTRHHIAHSDAPRTINVLEEFKYNCYKSPMLRLRPVEVSADGTAILEPMDPVGPMWAAKYVVEKGTEGRKKGASATLTPTPSPSASPKR